jgi:hypothetical protein
MSDQAGVPSLSAGKSPLWAVLVFSWISSLGTGLTANGIYFLTKHAYRFDVVENYALGLAMGLTYIVGALGASPLLRAARRRGGSTRVALGAVLVALAAVCFLPLLFPPRGEHPAHWPIWTLIVLYQPMSGALWPMLEGYLSGGRSGRELRSALGIWNITWCSALVVALWAMGPMVERHAPALMASLGVGHALSILLLWPLGREPGVHLEGEHEPHPPVYERLLTVFRVLLPTSYIVLTALSPYLPAALSAMGVRGEWQTPFAATWTFARVIMFFALQRWHGWHGRWWPAIAAVVLLLGGFGGAVLAPRLGSASWPVMFAGLFAFGCGMAAIYTGSLYYAMEVERADVDAGSTHEALIGVGYAGGPACGLFAAFAAHVGVIGSNSGDVGMLGLVGVIALSAALAAGAKASRLRNQAG